MPDIQTLEISVDDVHRVSALLNFPRPASACYVLAHGAGAGMTHPFLETVALHLGERGIATLRFQFPYMERRSRRPDPPRLAHATIRAAAAEASRLTNLKLIAGGRSFGGRMASQAQAQSPMPEVRGLAFLGFPLHPANKPSTERGDHLFQVQIPMLFLQGTHDALARMDLLSPLVGRFASPSTLKLFEGADHSFHVPARSGKTDREVWSALSEALADWIEMVV
jgi:predicted alpha/beta-hydrolase family hydrolase